MKKTTVYLLSIITTVFALGLFVAPVMAAPSSDELRQTIRDYILSQEERHGAFLILDERGEVNRRLSLVRVHERVGKTGDYYYSCTDMKDLGSGDELDLDFDISDQDGELKVVDIRIHKDNGKARYTYDDNDNMIPLS